MPSNRGRRGDRCIERRFLQTIEESEEVEELLRLLQTASDCKMTRSHVIRSLVKVIMTLEDEIQESIDARGVPDRPCNGDEDGTKRFEEAFSEVILDALERRWVRGAEEEKKARA